MSSNLPDSWSWRAYDQYCAISDEAQDAIDRGQDEGRVDDSEDEPEAAS